MSIESGDPGRLVSEANFAIGRHTYPNVRGVVGQTTKDQVCCSGQETRVVVEFREQLAASAGSHWF